MSSKPPEINVELSQHMTLLLNHSILRVLPRKSNAPALTTKACHLNHQPPKMQNGNKILKTNSSSKNFQIILMLHYESGFNQPMVRNKCLADKSVITINLSKQHIKTFFKKGTASIVVIACSLELITTFEQLFERFEHAISNFISNYMRIKKVQ